MPNPAISQRRTRRASAEQTRSALVRAGLRLFGQKGFEATSTRDIAAAANTNIASIAYHFGGKEGLRLACADEIVATLQGLAGAEAMAFAFCDDPDAALAFLEEMVARMVQFLTVGPQSQDIVAFVLREVASPGAAMDTIYSNLFEPVHASICRIWAAAAGTDPEADDTKLSVFSIIGQALYFRIGRPIVLRRMNWKEIGPADAEKITAIVVANLRLAIEVRRKQLK